VSFLRFSTAGWDGEWLRTGWALLPRSGVGVGRIEHVQALANADCSEELVIDQASNFEYQLQMLRVQEGWRGRRLRLVFVSLRPDTSVFVCNSMGLFGGSSSTTQVVCSSFCAAQGPGTPVERGSASAAAKQVGGSQLSGTVNILLSEKSGGSSKSGSSSTKVLGGELAAVFTRRRLCLAMLTAR
jgi:hypothetical protein